MDEQHMIQVNQVGYVKKSIKVAISTVPGPFQVRDRKTNLVVLERTSSGPIEDQDSNQTIYQLDFTEMEAEGTYQLSQSGVASPAFTIGTNVYQPLHKGLTKAFYYFRCGMDLTEQYAGKWAHKACHLQEGTVYHDPSRRLDSSGGWHDAGDYGKYTVAAAKALADLLLACQYYPGAFQYKAGIPESEQQMPDILNECQYELDWLLKMQDKETGGVFHKLTTKNFPGLAVMPEEDQAELYFSPVSATATATFAAIMAVASRVYKEVDEDHAEKYLEAAHDAWNWLEQHPVFAGFKNPSEITTGEYGDKEDRDERYWAAAELYCTTKEAKYHRKFCELAGENFDKISLGWADVGGYGTRTYLSLPSEMTDPAIYQELKSVWMEKAEQLVDNSKENGYVISLKTADYIWGSNMVLLNQAMFLLMTNRLAPDKKYERYALEHLHYLLGRNATNYSYVTGFGENAVRNIHHRPSAADNVEEPVPGLVSGGPDRGLHDPCAAEKLQGCPPAKCFIDHQESYATNEVTIYWNSPAVFVVSHWVGK
ncbi:glycoside hydrolase [Gracilibacillus oryzae]|uniref:Endoglucanase n=1 Tax=Gracilibacillus oryzae TaxID=1672701 RepID=A0A7C8KVJ2_9BACI|nr:glycoside hydrolase family 9 protein [Gracilibacillus oryzae]KAB8125811.1 glycoside hydrolase [Gracilibacillus oryzae]